MTDNNELYAVVGNILKEFKIEVEEKIEGALLATNDYVKGSNESIELTQSALDDLIGAFELSEIENKKSNKIAFDLAKEVWHSSVKLEDNCEDNSKLLIELANKIKTLTEREADNTVASIVRQDETDKIIKFLSDKNKDALEKHFSDTVEAIESIKIEDDDKCKDKLNEQYASLRKDYVDLHNNVNESFKNVPSNKELFEIVEVQNKEIAALKEELQLQESIDLLAETKAYIDEITPSLKGDTGSLERVIEWHKDYPREINQVVTHNNSLWQLKYEDSNEEPSDSDDWRLLIAGITDIKISPDKENKIHLTITDGTDKQYSNEIILPIPNMLDTWDSEAEYKFYDNVKKDGCRWITHKDSPQGVPGDSPDWHIDSLPAQRGRKGEKGEEGEKGDIGYAGHSPTKQEIITIINEDS